MTLIEGLPPGVIIIVGGLLLPLLRGRLQAAATVVLPALSLAHLLALDPGTSHHLELFGYQLTLVRIDTLSFAFGLIFHLAAILTAVFSLHVRDAVQHVAGMTYVGSAIGAVFAGDLLTLFVYWELTAITSVFLIWASRNERAYRSGMRYLIIQVGSGVLLLGGIVLYWTKHGTLEFNQLIGDDGLLSSAGPGVLLIFFAFGIKAAFPLLHNWLQDAYPNATITGTVFLSAFTTKLAIYVLARGFPGTEVLVPIGVIMTLFPVFFAVIENDLRKVLAYSLNNQLGFMVVGIGIGTAMSLDGTVAHAFCHILYKALLFMSMGALLYRAGTVKASELGGLYKSMPLTTACCIVGAMSISAFPLFSGFVSKSLVMTAAGDTHRPWVFFGLLVASAGVMEHSGIKIPVMGFFGKDRGIRVREAPAHMLVAMGVTAAACIFLGCFPGVLYQLLPSGGVGYQSYTTGHVVSQLQLLLFAVLAFGVLIKTRLYPHEVPSVNLDFDWFYRVAAPRLVDEVTRFVQWARSAASTIAGRFLRFAYGLIYTFHGPHGVFARSWTTGAIAFWAVIGLWGFLALYFWG